VIIEVIRQVTQASERTVRRWVARYEGEGVEGLRERWSGGNNRKLTEAQREQIKEHLRSYRPVDLGLSRGEHWTVSDLKAGVEQWYGVVYRDEDSYQQLFHASRFSYQRSAKVYRNQPSAADIAAFEDDLQKSNRFPARVPQWTSTSSQ
jgi:transposase